MPHYRYIYNNMKNLEITGYGCMLNISKPTPGFHTHSCYECNVILEGTITDTTKHRKVRLSKGECDILAPGDYHSVESDSETVPLILTLMAMPDEIDKLCKIYGDIVKESFNAKNTEKLVLTSEELSIIERDYHQLYFLDDAGRSNSEKILFLHIIGCLIRKYNTKKLLHSHPKIEYALTSMNNIENLSEGLPALIRLSKMSRAQLYRHMKKYYNQTPLDYITNLRMQYAANMLIHSNKSVLDICMEVGYFSESHFITLFKEFFGISPLKYRHQNLLITNSPKKD